MDKNNLRVPYALAVHGKQETDRVLKVLNEHRTIMGRETKEFEERCAHYFGKKYGVMVNSGSSANLLSIELLDLPPSSEIITPLLTFSTTIAPLVQKGLIPVFTDVIEGYYTINVDQIEKLINNKTKAIMVPLLLGNIPNLPKLKSLAKKYNLYLIDDSCDTFGATYKNKPSGSYTNITTTSFYGSHIITAGGGGGMIFVNSKVWRNRAKVLRGWGRSSTLLGETEDVNIRYKSRVAGIPYDRKFIFSDIGYNFMPSEIGAAFGNAQLDKLDKFRKIREYNFSYLQQFFQAYKKYFILPEQDKNVKTQWLAFPLCIKNNSQFDRKKLAMFLEQNNIQTRPIFTGNILKQPGFKHIQYRMLPQVYPITEKIMKSGILIGCHHGIEKKHLKKIEQVFKNLLKKYG